MEGPTPVSALIHAATMVTAGVYLIARSNPIFNDSQSARTAVATVGAITLLYGCICAFGQDDLKRVLAYSTVSQIGYMFLAVWHGGPRWHRRGDGRHPSICSRTVSSRPCCSSGWQRDARHEDRYRHAQVRGPAGRSCRSRFFTFLCEQHQLTKYRTKKKKKIDDVLLNLDPFAIWKALMTNEKPGGHGERSVAVGTIDMAVWDAVAKIEGKPLYRLLADRYRNGVADDKVWVYAAGGYYYPGKDDAKLQDEMRSYLDRGYDVVKMKIGAAPLADDIRRIESVLKVVGDGRRLAVDANGRFDLDTAIAYAEALKPYNLFWYEEAGDPLDYALQAELAKHYDLPMATGENLFSHQDARNLLRHGGMRPDRDFVQFDCALSYGLVEYMRTLKVMEEMGWSSRRVVPHGGHQMSLNIAAGLHLGGNESYPDVFQPFGGFADGIRWKTVTSACRIFRVSASKPSRVVRRDARAGVGFAPAMSIVSRHPER